MVFVLFSRIENKERPSRDFKNNFATAPPMRILKSLWWVSAWPKHSRSWVCSWTRQQSVEGAQHFHMSWRGCWCWRSPLFTTTTKTILIPAYDYHYISLGPPTSDHALLVQDTALRSVFVFTSVFCYHALAPHWWQPRGHILWAVAAWRTPDDAGLGVVVL